MSVHLVTILAEAIETYYNDSDFLELCDLYDINVEYNNDQIAYLKTARKLITQIEHGNNRKLLQSLIPSLSSRNINCIANTSWDTKAYHENMNSRIGELFSLIESDQLPEQISVDENKPFTAKSEAREFIGKAETSVIIVDNYIGIGTLDCLRDTCVSIRILTGSKSQNIEKNFNKSFAEFLHEGHKIEIRCHAKLHDRYIIFNDRCWLVGSSLKDAGKKELNIIECIDIKDRIVIDVEKKWSEAEPYTV